ncbi:unnamed protein product [Parnassius apollo]|uniref:(apollo) hypothetical protein n=1 Tax=Parnassius apollo TaxID=110799 RepID=A0A8S3WTU4_PARAO|nr:unnamed protein product [Parnassius apollo]
MVNPQPMAVTSWYNSPLNRTLETETPRSQRGTSSDQQSPSQAVNPPNNETFSVAVDQSHSSNQVSITNEQVPSPSLQDQQSSSRTAAVNRPHKTSQTKKNVEQNETLTELQHLENIATAINNPGSNEKEKDEFYYFGQSVAAQLRLLPLNNALDMQSKIRVLLSTKRSRFSTSYSQPSTPYSNTSIYSEETAASSADDRFIHIIPYTQSNTTEDNTITFGQESGQNIFNQAWNNA